MEAIHGIQAIVTLSLSMENSVEYLTPQSPVPHSPIVLRGETIAIACSLSDLCDFRERPAPAFVMLQHVRVCPIMAIVD